jgi:hypothetical protein
MLYTYRGKVDENGAIRLREEINLPTGGEVLVTLLDKDAFVSLIVSTGATGYSEERLREEMEEDEFWAAHLKILPSL